MREKIFFPSPLVFCFLMRNDLHTGPLIAIRTAVMEDWITAANEYDKLLGSGLYLGSAGQWTLGKQWEKVKKAFDALSIEQKTEAGKLTKRVQHDPDSSMYWLGYVLSDYTKKK